MTGREPANAAELHAAMLECADANIAVDEARADAKRIGEQYADALTAVTRALLRQRNATAEWFAIRPKDTP